MQPLWTIYSFIYLKFNIQQHITWKSWNGSRKGEQVLGTLHSANSLNHTKSALFPNFLFFVWHSSTVCFLLFSQLTGCQAFQTVQQHSFQLFDFFGGQWCHQGDSALASRWRQRERGHCWNQYVHKKLDLPPTQQQRQIQVHSRKSLARARAGPTKKVNYLWCLLLSTHCFMYYIYIYIIFLMCGHALDSRDWIQNSKWLKLSIYKWDV